MSSYVVSKPTIDAMVTAALHWSRPNDPFGWYYGPDPNAASTGACQSWLANDPHSTPVPSAYRQLVAENATKVGRGLWETNLAAVQDRYDSEEAETAAEVQLYRLDRLPGVPPPAYVLRVIRTYEYQAQDLQRQRYQDTEAHEFCRQLEAAAIHQLPGYDLLVPETAGRMAFLNWASQASSAGVLVGRG
jgi:hypothetical protein